jgi:K+-sensing histidine kinase KdpD
VVKENEKYHQINGHQIKLAENKYQKFTLDINLHKPSFAKVIKECLINALKFSEPNTNIYIFYEVTKDGFQISILNSPPKNSEYPEGLPIAYHRLIFEPFFRLSRFVFEDYETLDYGMGLCYADKIIKNHNGKMNISNLKSHLEEDQGILIKFMIELPFLA